MNTEINDERLFLSIPNEQIDEGSKEQIMNLLRYDFVKKLAIMPDVHMGYTMPIGGIGLFDNVISPECVGYDIGCGMGCIVTNVLFEDVVTDANLIRAIVEKEVPVGFNSHKKEKAYRIFNDDNINPDELLLINKKIKTQLGTLGGGNHFIEIGQNREGHLCIVVHSGSRGAGHAVAGKYMKLSKGGSLPSGFLFANSDLGLDYFEAMEFMTQYAIDNRKMILNCVSDALGIGRDDEAYFINENHNFVSYYEGGLLHRKGATPAELGQLGVIPGNMRDGTYITRGLGNKDFLSCASHGAGRVGSRKWAKKTLDHEKFTRDMQGVSCRTEGRLDEAPGAYKSIKDVIKYQEGITINVVDHITPKIVIKG